MLARGLMRRGFLSGAVAVGVGVGVGAIVLVVVMDVGGEGGCVWDVKFVNGWVASWMSFWNMVCFPFSIFLRGWLRRAFFDSGARFVMMHVGVLAG